VPLLSEHIEEPGRLNRSAMRRFGKTYYALSDSQRQEILDSLKKQGYSEKELLGMQTIHLGFRKRKPDHVKEKAKTDIAYVSRELFP